MGKAGCRYRYLGKLVYHYTLGFPSTWGQFKRGYVWIFSHILRDLVTYYFVVYSAVYDEDHDSTNFSTTQARRFPHGRDLRSSGQGIQAQVRRFVTTENSTFALACQP